MKYEEYIDQFGQELSDTDKLSENRYLTLCKIFKGLRLLGLNIDELDNKLAEKIYMQFHKSLPTGLNDIYLNCVIEDIKKASIVLTLQEKEDVVSEDGMLNISADDIPPKEVDEDYLKELDNA